MNKKHFTFIEQPYFFEESPQFWLHVIHIDLPPAGQGPVVQAGPDQDNHVPQRLKFHL